MKRRLFAALAARPGDAPVLHGDGAVWNAAALRAEVAALSGRLAGCRVLAVLADNGPEWVMADLAALAVDAVHLPLPAFFHPAQLQHSLDQAGADAALSDQPERLEALGFRAVGRWRGLTLLRRHIAAADLPAGTRKITFTSGSTGAPKGVCLGDGLLATAEGLLQALARLPMERHLAVLPLSLLLENVAGVYAPLLRGMEIHLPPLAALGWRGMAGFDPHALAAQVAAREAHSLILVPELLKGWLASGAAVPPSPRFIAVGGARCDAGLIQAARDRGLPVYQGYGLTEGGSVTCLNIPGADRPDAAGRPLPHARVKVDDAGEVWVNHPALLGYLGQARPESPEFATGDLGHLDDDGFLHLEGRRSNVLITGFGRNISPEWVEAALLARPEIAQAVVVGEARPWLAALLVPMPGVPEDAVAAAVAAANESLPDYARVRGWRVCPPFTAENGLATGNGRPRRAAIAEHGREAIESIYATKEPRP